jgi:hypothetical protein
MKRVKLQVPRLTDMEYRQKILAQPETMSYNRGKDIEVESYHRDTGCIDFPREDWRYWRQMWLLNEPDFFSALITDEESGESQDFELLASATIDDVLYYALVPVDEEAEEYVILSVEEDGDDIVLSSIDDDDVFEKVEEYFNDLFFSEVDYDA